MEQAIADRLQDLIREENLPYVTAYDPVFQETTEEDASGTGLPIGTWLQMGLQFRLSRTMTTQTNRICF